MNVQLADYDYVVLNTSAGKDSQTAMRFVLGQAERECYPPDRILAAHADLGRMEWPGTAELAAEQCAHYGIRLAKVHRSEDLLAQIDRRGKFPDSQNRFCTSDHKRDQIAKLFTELTAGLDGAELGRPVRILNVMGMRAQESPARALLKPLSRNNRVSTGRKVVDNWLPLHEWQLPDIWADIKASGVKHHWAYDSGMPRLSCMFCIFANPAALMIAGRHNPELLGEYVALEQKHNFTFRKNFSLKSVQEAITRGEDWGKATDWVM